MPRTINYQGKKFTFSDKMTDAQISEVLKKSTPTPLQSAMRSDIAKFAAPVVGAIGGGTIGTTLGAGGGSLVPGPGTVIGGIAGGMRGAGLGAAGLEAAREALAGEQINPEKLLQEGVLNAATEPAGLALKAGAKAVGAAGSRLLGGVTGKTVAEAGPKYAPEMVAQIEKSVAGPIGERQIAGRLAASNLQKKSLLKAADATGNTVYARDLLQPVEHMVDELKSVGSAGAAKVEKLATDWMARLKNAKLTPSRVDAIKKAAEAEAKRIYQESGVQRAGGKVARRLTGRSAQENFQIALAEGARNWLEQLPTHGPAIAESNSSIKSLMHAQDAMRARPFAKGLSRYTGAALGAPLQVPYHLGALGGYAIGPQLEPLSTTVLGAGTYALQNPILAALLQQVPRVAGQGFMESAHE